MRTLMTRSVPGTSSCGRLRRAVPRHVIHPAVTLLGEPALEVGLVLGELDACDADLVKAEFACKCVEPCAQFARVRSV